MQNDFTENIVWTKEAAKKYNIANIFYNLGKIKKSAEILNSIPSLPKNELLLKISDNYLNLKRRTEKLYYLYGKIPLRVYIKKVRTLFDRLIQSGLCYSALRAGIEEVMALEWMGEVERLIERIEELKKLIGFSNFPSKNFSYLLFELRFTLLISEGIANASLLKIKEAKKIARTCCALLKSRKEPSPYLMADLGALYNSIEEYKSAEYWLLKAVDKVDKDSKRIYSGALAHIYFLRAKYKKLKSILESSTFYAWGEGSRPLIYQSFLSLLKGSPSEAISLAISSLDYSKKQSSLDIFSASFAIATVYTLLGEKTKARSILKKLIPFLEKNRLNRQKFLLEMIFYSNFRNLQVKNLVPSLNLIYLIKNKGYYQALSYAREKGILTAFYNYIFFFPELIVGLLEKGKPTRLPKAILRLPVFNKEARVYHVKFLGNLVIFKNQKYLKTKLKPKDSAFLIYLCTKAMEPQKTVNLDEVYNNLWPKSEMAPRNFAHLLVRVKKALKIPPHLLTVSRGYGEPELINEGIYFTTDLQEFEQTFARAKALERAGEWSFAKKEYLRAFNLFRGEPFKKNFDDWSVDMRFKILFQLETEAINFARSSLEHNNKKDAKSVLQKVLKIIPDAEEIEKTLANLKLNTLADTLS